MCNLLLRSCSFGSLDIGVPQEILEWIISWKATRKIPIKVFIFLPNCEEFKIRGLISKIGSNLLKFAENVGQIRHIFSFSQLLNTTEHWRLQKINFGIKKRFCYLSIIISDNSFYSQSKQYVTSSTFCVSGLLSMELTELITRLSDFII